MEKISVAQSFLTHDIHATIHYTSGRSDTKIATAADCAYLVMNQIRAADVRYIDIGLSRAFVRVHKTGVSSVIFYDCFFFPPADREGELEKQAYDHVCEVFAEAADVVLRTYDDYIDAVNKGLIKSAFDARDR